MLTEIPTEWKRRNPKRVYETRFLYTGLSRYNIETKTVSKLSMTPDGKLLFSEVPYEGTVLSKSYATECVRIVVYSESPRVWVEELSPTQQHFFQQVN